MGRTWVIKEVVQSYIRHEKGVVSKGKYWVPKYMADPYDCSALALYVQRRRG